MQKIKTYTPSTKMCDLISENYNMLLLIFRFEIPLGVGEKTIREICEENDVDEKTFLFIVNFLLYREGKDASDLHKSLSMPLIIRYLQNSHNYFLDYRLPTIRLNLFSAIEGCPPDVTYAIRKFYDEYVEEVNKHMQYENKYVFPYVEKLLEGEKDSKYSIEIFRKRHDQVELKMMELKNILIKYYPAQSGYKLNTVLHDIFSCEEELKDHNDVEDHIFTPAIIELEKEFL